MTTSVISSISSYAELHHAFKFALKDAGLLKLAFLPKKKNNLTYALWAAATALVANLILGFLVESGWVFPAAMVCEMIVFLLAELQLQRGVRLAFPMDSVVHNIDKQPWKLRRPLIRYAYFIERLRTSDKIPSISQLDDTLAFIEINRTGRPPTWTGYLRHPLVLLIMGSFVYTFNAKIVGAPSEVADWVNFAAVSLWLTFLLFIGGLVYTFRYMDPNEEWQFECCLRWLKQQLEDSESQALLE